MKYNKPKFKTGNRVRISKNDIPLQKGNKPHFTDKVFETSALYTKKNLLYTS